MEKKKVVKLSVAIVLVLAVIAATFIAFGAKKTYIPINDDFDKLGNAYIKSALLRSYESEQDLKYEITEIGDELGIAPEQAKMIKDFVNGLKLNMKAKKAVENKKDIFELNMDLLVDDSSFVRLNTYVDDEMMVLELPGLYEKKIYVKWNDIDTILTKIDPSINEEINIEDYKRLFAPENLGKLKDVKGLEYYKVIKDALKQGLVVKENETVKLMEAGKEVSYPCDNYELTVKQDDMLKLTQNIMNKLLEDKNIKEFTKDKVNEIVDVLVKNGDYKIFGLTEEDLKEFKENFNKDYDTEYEKLVKEAKEGINKTMIEAAGQDATTSTTKYTFAIDKNNDIRKISAEQIMTTAGMSLKMATSGTVSNPNKAVKIVKPDLKDALNLAEMTEQQYMEMAQQIGMSIYGEAMKKPSIQKIVMASQGIPYTTEVPELGFDE